VGYCFRGRRADDVIGGSGVYRRLVPTDHRGFGSRTEAVFDDDRAVRIKNMDGGEGKG
jgi:hypothetical protein